jgi:hypothetical protein
MLEEKAVVESPEEAEVPVENKKTATEKVAEKIVEETGVEIENIVIEAAPEVKEEGQKVITGPAKPKRKLSSNVENNDENVFNSKAADRSFKKIIEEEPEKKNDNKVALWSNKNIRWDGIGTLKKGYNIVTKEASESWLSRNGIRKATPEEIATFYGK